MISRQLLPLLRSKMNTGKAIVLMGPRQTGKTTLLKELCKETDNYLTINCDDPDIRAQLDNVGEARLRQIIGKYKTVLVDEAQRVNNIGIALKIITDQMPEVQLLVSGSSALELGSEINEPLTGRKWEYHLYPLCWQELNDHYGFLEARKQLETRLVYGMYPEVVVSKPGEEGEVLRQLASSYLYKDLLTFEGLRKPELIEKLLRALALQVGQEVSYNELSQLLQVDRKTVMNYIDLFEKAFIVFRLQPLSRNVRNEINSSRKIYFVDNGIRNALIAGFQPISSRTDVGALWENFMVSERRKYLEYNRIWANPYFWRTYQQQELDYLEDRNGVLNAWEFKWNPKSKAKIPAVFLESYPNSTIQTIHPENFDTFLSMV